eukprot:3369170-Ditylum_brightwellii.AAC.1
MGDLNKYINNGKIQSFYNNVGMREIIKKKYGVEGAATTRSNLSRLAVDGIWTTMGVQIIACGYLSFLHYIQLDH